MLTNPQGQKHSLVGTKPKHYLVVWNLSGRAWLFWLFQRASKLITMFGGQELRLVVSSWSDWVGWHGEQKINPHACQVNFFLDFLEHLIEQKLAYSTISSHRSVISA